jgi:tetratricopeptide (TPR) repeat protein
MTAVDSAKLNSEIVPTAFRETLEWLLTIEDFSSARSLVKTIYRYLPVGNPESTDFLAHVLHRAKFYQEAAEAALLTLSLIPTDPRAKFNAAKCLNSAARPAEAERLAREVVEQFPGWLDPEIDLAAYVGLQGRNDESLGILSGLLSRIPPNDPNRLAVKFNLGWHQIRLNNFKEGMRNLSGGREIAVWGTLRGDKARAFNRPLLQPNRGRRR